jgi:hypothetical protein
MTDLLLFDDETLDAAEYSPTPEDIEAELLAIQGEWTPEERLRRRGGGWSAPEVRTPDWRET